MLDLQMAMERDGFVYIGRVKENVKPVLAKKVTDGAIKIEREAKILAPRGVSSRLANSINHDVRQTMFGVVGAVGTNVTYAPFQEFGTKRHFVPFSVAPDLLDWLRRKAKITPMSVGGGRYDLYIRGTNTLIRRAAKGIFVSGEAQPYLTPAFEKHIDDIIRDIEQTPEDIQKGV